MSVSLPGSWLLALKLSPAAVSWNCNPNHRRRRRCGRFFSPSAAAPSPPRKPKSLLSPAQALSTLTAFNGIAEDTDPPLSATAARHPSLQSPSMAASQGRITTTASVCSPETARGRHIFEVTGYSLLKGIGVTVDIESTPFTVGGYEWCISYCPDGDEDHEDYASIFLYLRTETDTQVRAHYELSLLNPATGLSSLVRAENWVFSVECPTTHTANFMKRSELEASYLRGDRLVIECDLTVILGKPEPKSKSFCEIQVPPSKFLHNVRKLLESAEGADVTFMVQDEVFRAHKIVLAMQSPVFKAELLGPMSGKSANDITLHIEDMQPAVFKSLLHFIYNDSLPAMEDLDGDDNEEMVKHLLVAADRYAVERMKVICESILSKKLDLDNVATTLALADQHHCSQLKDSCIEFINSSNRLDELVDSQGYAQLKRACPTVIAEIWEKSAKPRKI